MKERIWMVCWHSLLAGWKHNQFPHEIGVFLADLLQDAIGFIENQG